MNYDLRLILLLVPPVLLIGWVLFRLLRRDRRPFFQFRYWQLLIAVVIGSLWTWALVDWTVLEGQRERALTEQRRKTVLQIRDQVAVEACRAFLKSDYILSDEKRRELTSALDQFMEKDPQIVRITVGAQLHAPHWGVVISSRGPCDATGGWHRLGPPSDEITGYRGAYQDGGETFLCEFYCVRVVVPELKHKEVFQLGVYFVPSRK